MALGTAIEQLCELYNEANPTLPVPLSVSDFSVVKNYASTQNGKNYAIDIKATSSSQHFTGEMTWLYNRITKNSVWLGSKDLTDQKSKWEDNEFVISRFNEDLFEKFGDTIEPVYIRLERYTPGWEPTALAIDVYIKAGHLKFEDGIAVSYSITEIKQELSVANGDLSGFN